ncbi:hypothetical protein FGO68_gene12191 [Halteria grandinella]|uniref:Uncharacterized protein n=1 Tax=Halteria grandinella TaxID=5974 RepID=A0A8J8P8S3_HALGN|nr:hypothetical protein FGO68_gene12191 [Halteria grandinella]
MLDSQGSAQSIRVIKVSPEELYFDQLTYSDSQQQTIVLMNTLSDPVDIQLEAKSNKVTVEPKQMRLVPSEETEIVVTAKLPRPPAGTKTPKSYKEVIMLKSEFFNQKISLTLVPHPNPSDSHRSSSRTKQSALQRKASKSPDNQLETLQTQVKDYQDEITSLKQKIADFESQPSEPYSQYLSDIKALLKEREPKLEQLMEITLRKERMEQEAKDQTILKILKAKDQQIGELEERVQGQEEEYGQINMAFQDIKKRNKHLEEQVLMTSALQQKLDMSQLKVESLEKGKEYRRLLEAEERVRELTQYSQGLEAEITQVQTLLAQKENMELYLQEVLARYKDQLSERDEDLRHLTDDFEREKELRIRADQQARIYEGQLRGESTAKIHSEAFDRISRLQDEKTELLSQFEQARKDKIEIEDQVRHIIDRLSDYQRTSLGQSMVFNQRQSAIDILAKKVEDLISLCDQQAEELPILTKQLTDARQSLDQKEQDLKQAISDNKELSLQVHQHVSKKTLSRPVQTEVELEDMEIYEEMREKSAKIEDHNDAMGKAVREKERKIGQLQVELEHKNQEVQLLLSRGHNEVFSDHCSSQQDEPSNILRLQARITQLKQNEEILLQELSKSRASQSMGAVVTNSRTTEHEAQMKNELESIVYEQRDKLIALEEENVSLKRQVKEVSRQCQSEVDQLQLRLKNVQEINKQFEKINGRGIQKEHTQVEAERLRQNQQSLELQVLTQKHQIDELKLSHSILSQEAQKSKEDLAFVEKQLIKAKHDLRLSSTTGMNIHDNDKSHQQLAEQKKQIKFLQGLLIRAKQDFDSLKAKNGSGQSSDNQSNDRLRKEHQQAILAAIDLKEEYSSKLLALNDTHELMRQKYTSEIHSLQQSVNTLTAKLSYMEKKEVKLFGQLEEAKEQHIREATKCESRVRDLEEILLKREASIGELEREVRIKDKTLMERQEQIAVLIGTLEGDHSQDETKQKLINLSAELCSVKAIESQQERKLSDLYHQFKKSELSQSKAVNQLDILKEKYKDIASALTKSQDRVIDLDKKLQELSNSLSDKERQLSDLKFQVEKEQYQNTLKEESLRVAREHTKKQEVQFKEEINKQRKDFYSQLSKEYTHKCQADQTLQFKTALNLVHVALSDYQGKVSESSDKALLTEFEKSLQVASNTIDELHEELDKAHFINARFREDLRANALNKILISRNELLNEESQSAKSMLVGREQSRESYIKEREQGYSKIIKELEQRNNLQQTELNEREEEITQLSEKLRQAIDKKDELEQSLFLFQQEQESKRYAMEKKAELTVDERYKSRHESIKMYFDSQITKILLTQNLSSSDKIVELGREILSLKLLNQKLEARFLQEQSESQSLEITLAHYKDQLSIQESKLRETQGQIISHNQKGLQATLKLENQKLRQEMSNVEKELIKVRDQLDQRLRESILSSEKEGPNRKQQERIDTLEIQNAEKDQIVRHQSGTIEQLQTKLIEIRTQHIHELDGLRGQYESDLAENRRLVIIERQNLEKRYLPGHTPGEIVEENQELARRIQDLKANMEQLMQDNALARRKLDNERQMNETLIREVDSYKQALIELEQTMIDMNPHQMISQVPNLDSGRGDRSTSRGRNESKRKSIRSLSKNGSKRPVLLREESKQHILDDSSSLQTSTITQDITLQPTLKPGQAGRFQLNPPAIVRALVQSKINELTIMRKNEELLRVEAELRQHLKDAKLRELSQGKSGPLDQLELQRSLYEAEIELEDMKHQRATEHAQNIHIKSQTNPTSYVDRLDYPHHDYVVMVEALLCLSTQLAQFEAGIQTQDNSNPLSVNETSQKAVEEAQRLVIRALQTKAYQGISTVDSQFNPPSDDQDRKLWYLELLEQQVLASENVTTSLQAFIKKLSIDIQGNLQSAASIKSASMDLANNLKRTSEEVKTLKHVIGLAKHDLNKVTFIPTQAPQAVPQGNNMQKTLNPFASDNNLRHSLYPLQNPQQSAYNQLLAQQDSLQNSLTITERVKKSLEDELVQLKVSHQQELQRVNHELNKALDQRNLHLQDKDNLMTQISEVELRLQELKEENQRLSEDRAQTQAVLMDKEREKQVLAQNKSATSKHLQKLQQDMQEWRRQSEDTLRLKEKQIEELSAQVQGLSKEKDRLKSENLMLRRVDKDRRAGETDEIKKVQEENEELKQRMEQSLDERKREIEYWVSERATMREMIEQLENEKVANAGAVTVHATEDEQRLLKLHIKRKAHKKLKEKELELKTQLKVTEDLRDQLLHQKQAIIQLESRLREQADRAVDCEERVRSMAQKVREVELERDLVLAEKNNAINENDLTAQHIQSELNSLRECFAKLKIERDNLLYEIDSTSQREREWRATVDRLSGEVSKLEAQIQSRERDQNHTVKSLESKHSTLTFDLNCLRTENDKLKDRLKHLESIHLMNEHKAHSADSKAQEIHYALENCKTQLQEARHEITRLTQDKADLQSQLVLTEAQKLHSLDALNMRVNELRDSNSYLSQLYEAQIGELKARLMAEGKRTPQQADAFINLAQREAVIKQLKKELTMTKASLAKSKAKGKEMKQLLQANEKENLSNNSQSTKHSTARKPASKLSTSRQQPISQDESTIIKLANTLLSVTQDKSTISLTEDSAHTVILDNLMRLTKCEARCIDLQVELEKAQTQLMLGREQVNDLKAANAELGQQLDEMGERVAQANKEGKAREAQRNLSDLLDQTKSQLRQTLLELQTLRQEWIPPSEARSLTEKVKDLQGQVKALKDEVARKKEVIGQLKAVKEGIESEAREVAADLEGLKDDNAKMSRLIKENAKQLSLVKELKQANDQLKVTEKRLREEVISLSEKLRLARTDAQRKESLARDLKDRIDNLQDESSEVRERQIEIERLKEQVKKLKLEVEIKDNQVRTLKVKLDHFEGEMLKKSQKDESTSEFESQLKTARAKLHKSEKCTRKALESLKKIAKEILALSNSLIFGKQQPKPMMIAQSPKQQQDAQFYKDSVNILGMSIDELMDDFVAPQQQASMISKGSSAELSQMIERLINLGSGDDLCELCDQVANLCVKILGDLGTQKK